MTEPTYPLAAPEDDPRFTFGLTVDVAEVLTRQGYPPVTGVDFVQLQQALFRFLYRQNAPRVDQAATAV